MCTIGGWTDCLSFSIPPYLHLKYQEIYSKIYTIYRHLTSSLNALPKYKLKSCLWSKKWKQSVTSRATLFPLHFGLYWPYKKYQSFFFCELLFDNAWHEFHVAISPTAAAQQWSENSLKNFWVFSPLIPFLFAPLFRSTSNCWKWGRW